MNSALAAHALDVHSYDIMYITISNVLQVWRRVVWEEKTTRVIRQRIEKRHKLMILHVWQLKTSDQRRTSEKIAKFQRRIRYVLTKRSFDEWVTLIAISKDTKGSLVARQKFRRMSLGFYGLLRLVCDAHIAHEHSMKTMQLMLKVWNCLRHEGECILTNMLCLSLSRMLYIT